LVASSGAVDDFQTGFACPTGKVKTRIPESSEASGRWIRGTTSFGHPKVGISRKQATSVWPGCFFVPFKGKTLRRGHDKGRVPDAREFRIHMMWMRTNKL
jgi:hypothetical protein